MTCTHKNTYTLKIRWELITCYLFPIWSIDNVNFVTLEYNILISYLRTTSYLFQRFSYVLNVRVYVVIKIIDSQDLMMSRKSECKASWQMFSSFIFEKCSLSFKALSFYGILSLDLTLYPNKRPLLLHQLTAVKLMKIFNELWY